MAELEYCNRKGVVIFSTCTYDLDFEVKEAWCSEIVAFVSVLC